jgi:acyl CoA:acetate/3-ketoacid CoA transferase beta subunit
MLGDAQMVLGALVGGAGTTTIGCLGGAQIDRFGNVNSTRIEPRPFLVGSGGGNDVASTATENVVVATLTPQRTPAECSYITSPGRTVRALVTDLGLLETGGEPATAELVLSAVPAGDATLADRIAAARAACGWDLAIAQHVDELPAPSAPEVEALRRWDPRGWFLRAR